MTASADRGEPRRLSAYWPVIASFMLVLALTACLNVLASNMYVPPPDAHALAWAVSYLPSFLKSSALALILVSLFVFRYGAEGRAIGGALRQAPSLPLLALHVGFFAALAIWLARTPPLSMTTGQLSSLDVLIFVLSPLAWIGFAVAGLLAIVSQSAIFKLVTRGRLLAFGALVVVGTLYFSNGRPLDIVQPPFLIELVVTIASGVYGFFGGSMTLIGHSPQGYPIFAARDFRAIVEPSCSGFQGVVLISTILLGFTLLEYRRLNVVRVLLLIPVAAGIIFVMNAARVAALFYIGAHWSPEIAVMGFHANFGILSVAVVAICAVAFIELAPVFTTKLKTERPSPAQSDEPDPLLLLPLCVIIGASVVTGIFTGSFNWLYPVHVAAAAFVLYRMRGMLDGQFESTSLLAIGVGILVFAIWIFLIPADPQASAEFAGKLYGAPGAIAALWLFFRLVGSVIVVPLAEEMAFRGFLQPLLTQHFSESLARPLATAAGLVGAAVIFGLLHANILAGVVAGIAYGLVYINRQRLGDAIIAHGVTNLLIAIYVLMLGQWSYW